MKSFASSLASALLGMFAAMLLVWAIYHPGDSTAIERGESLGLTFWVLGFSMVAIVIYRWEFPGTVISRASLTRPSFWMDALPVALAGWVSIAAWVNAGAFGDWDPELGGDLRAATNEAWWWIASAMWLLAMRRCMVHSVIRFGVLGLITSLGVLLAIHALHQNYISFPQMLATYQADPDAQLAMLGMDAPPGSGQRMIFENRLRDGGPTATFALANSLAGTLAMMTAASLGLMASLTSVGGKSRAALRARLPALGLVGFVSLLLLSALAITGSRSGVLAVAIIVGVLVGQRLGVGWNGSRQNLRFILAGVVVLITGIAIVAMDEDSWSQAPATLQLRFQYWRSTLAMVTDYPWFGSGPGNFQLVYQAYRDADAHELIAEPHNFVMETLASGGWVAVAILGAIMVMAARSRTHAVGVRESIEDIPDDEFRWMRWLAGVGGLAGLLWVWYYGITRDSLPDFEAHQWAVPMTIASVVAWVYWMSPLRSEIDFGRVGWMAAATGLLHLCFSGGWTVPGVALVLFCFIAMSLPLQKLAGTGESREKTTTGGIALLGVVLLFSLYTFSVRPVRRTNMAMKKTEQLLQRNRVANAQAVLRSSLNDDSLAAEPAIWLASIENRQILERSFSSREASVTREHEQIFATANERIGNNPSLLKAIGEMHLQRYQVTGQETDLQLAADVYAQMLKLSPTEQGYFAQAAEIQREQSQTAGASLDQANELAAKARELCEAGGVVTRAINFQIIMPARKIGRQAIGNPVKQSADEVFANW